MKAPPPHPPCNWVSYLLEKHLHIHQPNRWDSLFFGVNPSSPISVEVSDGDRVPKVRARLLAVQDLPLHQLPGLFDQQPH